MFDLINWSKVLDFFLGTILVSIPEELYLVLFSLILMKQFDFLGSKNEGESRIKARDIIEVAIITVIIAVLLRLLTILDVGPSIRIVLSIVLMSVVITIVYKLWSVEDILKTVMCVFLSVLSFMMIELLYVSLVIFITKKPVVDFNYNTVISFIWSLPERAVEYAIIAFLLVRKTTFFKAGFIKIITQSRMMKVIFSFFFIFNIGVFILLGKFSLFSNSFLQYEYSMQLIIIVTITLIPIVNITGLLWSIYYVFNKEQYKRYIAKESLKNMVNDLIEFTQSADKEKVDLVLKDIWTNIEDL